MKSFLQFLLFVLAITLALAGLYAWKSGYFDRAEPPSFAATATVPTAKATPLIHPGSIPGLAALDEEFGRVAEAVVPSVVSIIASRKEATDPREEMLRQFFGMGRSPQNKGTAAQGSGVIVSTNGHIVTNLHVIEGATEAMVSLADGRRFSAKLLGADSLSDIAVLKIDADGLHPLGFADSEKVRVGQLVFAVGNPFGLQESVTQGIISARERLFSSESVNEFFQTDAPINPGNSGGPLVNIRGEIVGLNNFIFSQSGGSQGIGFAIPSNTVRRVLEQILQHGRVLRPYFGVDLQPITPDGAARLGLADTRGALVKAVLSGSPAAKADVRAGDVIQKFDGREVRDFPELRKLVAEAKIGATIQIEVLRNGKVLKLPVQIMELPRLGETVLAPPPSGGVTPQLSPRDNAFAGVSVQEITPTLIAQYHLPPNIEGVFVRSVASGTSAASVLREGDVIEQINETPVTSTADFEQITATLPPRERAILLIARGRVRQFEVIGP